MGDVGGLMKTLEGDLKLIFTNLTQQRDDAVRELENIKKTIQKAPTTATNPQWHPRPNPAPRWIGSSVTPPIIASTPRPRRAPGNTYTVTQMRNTGHIPETLSTPEHLLSGQGGNYSGKYSGLSLRGGSKRRKKNKKRYRKQSGGSNRRRFKTKRTKRTKRKKKKN